MSRHYNGNVVDRVMEGSPAARAGIQPGDVILTINRKNVRDSIDLFFYADTPEISVSVRRFDKVMRFRVVRAEGEELGIELRSFRVKTCRNHCIFCFVNQLPRGLRRTLYLKDEDYRMSFLYGNYITLSNLTIQEKKRIIEQRLSPLYVSVHTTNTELRNRMLGTRCGVDIMKELRWLTGHRIRVHTQIVLCPGVNDGYELRNTIADLHRFYPYVSSIAVVPVGLTRHRKKMLNPVGMDDARNALEIVDDFQKRFIKRYGDPIVYGADELYIKAEKRFPSLRNYGEMPQLENGVGMVPLFISRARKMQPPKNPSGRRHVTFTGLSFYPFLKPFIDRLKERVNIELFGVANRFFGESVTVTGLITGRDIIQSLSDVASDFDVLILPDIVLRDGGGVLLDNVTVGDIESILGLEVRIVDSTPRGLIKSLEG